MAESSEGWIAEAEAARQLNVKRALLREARVAASAGQILIKNRAVFWSVQALREYAAIMGLPFAALEEKTPETPNGATALAIPEEAETLMVFCRAVNPNIVNALRANGEKVAVRVISNANYQPLQKNGKPMTLRATRCSAGSWWVCLGRDPRWPGMW